MSTILHTNTGIDFAIEELRSVLTFTIGEFDVRADPSCPIERMDSRQEFALVQMGTNSFFDSSSIQQFWISFLVGGDFGGMVGRWIIGKYSVSLGNNGASQWFFLVGSTRTNPTSRDLTAAVLIGKAPIHSLGLLVGEHLQIHNIQSIGPFEKPIRILLLEFIGHIDGDVWQGAVDHVRGRLPEGTMFWPLGSYPHPDSGEE